MTKALYVVGAPGVGKSSALLRLFPQMRGAAPYKLAQWTLLRFTSLGPNAAMLGVWREDFPGTDGLSMAVLPQAVDWARSAALPGILLGEGQRLASLTFLGELHDRPDVDLTVVHMVVQDPYELACRRSERTQNEQWVKAASTRAGNVASQCLDYGIAMIRLDTSDLTPEMVAAYLKGFIVKTKVPCPACGKQVVASAYGHLMPHYARPDDEDRCDQIAKW